MLLRLDLQFFAEEKTEKATPKKRQDSRKKGQVTKSQDVNTALLLLFSFILLFVFGGFMKKHVTALYRHAFSEYIHWDVTVETVHQVLFESVLELAKLVAPLMLIAVIAGITANFMQIGFLFTTEPLKLDLKKIDPIKGSKKIFSARALVELVKSLLKIVLIGVITFSIIWIFKDDMMMLAFTNIDHALDFFGNVTIVMGVSATLVLLCLAVLDYVYQRYDFEKNIRMSKQDIKDEFKNTEGDPQIKQKIKERQQQMATRRMMSEVPKADVVITNPTHFAIAVKYEEEKASAPYIVAKGVDHMAFRIKKIAQKNNVITIENRSLARQLYDRVEMGDCIPEEFYQAIAEILAYVYQLEKKLKHPLC